MTATALHIQAERGLVDYYQPVAKYCPNSTNTERQGHGVRCVDSPYRGSPDARGSYSGVMCDWDWMVGQIAEMHLSSSRGLGAATWPTPLLGSGRGRAPYRSKAPALRSVHPGRKSANPWASPAYGPEFRPRLSPGWLTYQFAGGPSRRSGNTPGLTEVPGLSASGWN